MGNCKSCCYAKPQTATIIHPCGNLRKIQVPVTAAEIMLDDPGHLVSPALSIRNTHRIPVMKADEELLAGEIYLVVPASRAGSKLSESETALIDSACEKRRPKLRSSKVLPTATTGEKIESPAAIFQENSIGMCSNSNIHQLGSRKIWTPALNPISEGTGEHL